MMDPNLLPSRVDMTKTLLFVPLRSSMSCRFSHAQNRWTEEIHGEYGAALGCDPANDDTSCCQSYAQCGLGEGDCDDDEDCSGDLVCGTNNCAAGRATLDCCESKYSCLCVHEPSSH